jgi:hypothetical protein
MLNSRFFSRREVIKSGALASATLPLIGLLRTDSSAAPVTETRVDNDPWHGLKTGVASYTLRKMPLDAAIKAIQRVGLSYVSIKDFHMPMKTTAEERRAVIRKFKEAGITPLSCGNGSTPARLPSLACGCAEVMRRRPSLVTTGRRNRFSLTARSLAELISTKTFQAVTPARLRPKGIG